MENDPPDSWPYDQPRNCATMTMRQVLDGSEPILLVSHDIEDHGWQFIGFSPADTADGRLVCLETFLRLDPTVLEVADLPPGWRATRTKIGGPWKREFSPPDPEDNCLPNLAANGYELEVVEQADGLHYPFLVEQIPNDEARKKVKAGDLVKLIFKYRNYVANNGKKVTGEHMWVLVTGVNSEAFVGKLDNTPQFSTILKENADIHFQFRHVVDIWRGEMPNAQNNPGLK
jgi:Uncharacterized protein conserved in bacteria (DUF2314)